MSKTTHFGRAGEFFIMSEFLLRGWNVAVPVVDVGDDVFVIDDNAKATWRVQVKAAQVSRAPDGTYKGTVTLSREQLRAAQEIELFYALLLRMDSQWRCLIIPRDSLHKIRRDFVERAKAQPAKGRPPSDDGDTKSDSLSFVITIGQDGPVGWGTSLKPYLEWPKDLSTLEDGPGARGLERGSAGATSEEAPAR